MIVGSVDELKRVSNGIWANCTDLPSYEKESGISSILPVPWLKYELLKISILNCDSSSLSEGVPVYLNNGQLLGGNPRFRQKYSTVC